MAKEKLISYVKKYKYVALVVLVGVVLMQCCVAWIVAFVVYTLVGIL